MVVGCWLFVANSNQSRSQHSFEHLTFILFVNLSYLPAIVSSAADFSWWGVYVPFFPTKWFWVFVSGSVFRSFFLKVWFSP